ncbi:MAG: CpaE family protein [Gemmataceae bacterium]
MFPLKAILVECSEKLSPHLRRELANQAVEIEAEHASISRLIEHCRLKKDEHRLFVTELQEPGAERNLRRLSGMYMGQPILAAVPPATSAEELMRWMRAGLSQAVTVPIHGLEFRASLDGIAHGFCARRGQARTIAVSNVIGGCGGTTVALNLAHELAFIHEQETILLEITFQPGMLGTLFDVTPQYTLQDLANMGDRLDAHAMQQGVHHILDRLSIVPGPHRSVPPAQQNWDGIARIIEVCRSLCDVLVLDLSTCFDEGYIDVLQAADQIVLVSEQRIPALRNLQMVLDHLGRDQLAARPQVVVNRYDPKLPGFGGEDLERLLHVEPHTIPADFMVGEAENHGRPLRVESERSVALASISQLTRKLLGIPEPAARVPASTLSRFCQAIGIA